MKLKLTSSQFVALYIICHSYLQSYLPSDMENKLLHVLLTKFFRRIYNMSFEKKKKYSLTMKPEEAMAFWLAHNNHEHEMTSQEGNLLTMICNQIHQRFEYPNYLTQPSP